MTPLTYPQALALAVDVAEPIITDGAANTIGPAMLADARAVLDAPRHATPEQVESLAEVVALAQEYLTCGVELSARDREALGQLTGTNAAEIERFRRLGMLDAHPDTNEEAQV